jgi:MFS family permease
MSNLMEVFDVSAATVQWLSTGFMLINGVLVPITAFLMKRFTTRQLFISSMLSLFIGTVLCACAIGTAVIITVYTIQSTSQLSSENGSISAMQVTKLASIFSSSDAYVFMLVLSFVALIIACFMPKKVALQKSESKS